MIVLDNVTKTYHLESVDVNALRRVSLHIEAGEWVAYPAERAPGVERSGVAIRRGLPLRQVGNRKNWIVPWMIQLAYRCGAYLTRLRTPPPDGESKKRTRG